MYTCIYIYIYIFHDIFARSCNIRWMVAKSESPVENGGKHPMISRLSTIPKWCCRNDNACASNSSAPRASCPWSRTWRFCAVGAFACARIDFGKRQWG